MRVEGFSFPLTPGGGEAHNLVRYFPLNHKTGAHKSQNYNIEIL